MQSIFAGELNSLVIQLEENFANLIQRKLIIERLKDKSHMVEESCSKDIKQKYKMRAAMVLAESLHRCDAEKLTEKQLNIIKITVNMLDNKTVSREKFLQIDDLLRDNNLDWLPHLQS